MYANLNLEGRIVSDLEFRTGKGNVSVKANGDLR